MSDVTRAGIPPSYSPVAVRCVLPPDPQGRRALAFDLEDGEVLRVVLDRKNTERLLAWLRGDAGASHV